MSNEEQSKYWNGEAGETWVEAQERLDALLEPLNSVALGQLNVSPGQRVLDVGCGCGTTSFALADSGAHVTGIDISEPMLAHARNRAVGRDNVEFSHCDASTATFEELHDCLFSRFGVMFFDDPHGAFGNLRKAMKPGAQLLFLCWQKPADNPWVSTVGRAVQAFLPEPEETPDPRAPGPFAFAEPDYVKDILTTAGFSDISVESITRELKLGDDLDAALSFQSRVGPMARVLAELDDEPRAKATEAAREALAPHLRDDGLWLGGAVWLVQARAA